MPGDYEFNLLLENSFENNSAGTQPSQLPACNIEFKCKRAAAPSFPITLPPKVSGEPYQKEVIIPNQKEVIIPNAPKIIKIVITPSDHKVKHPRKVKRPDSGDNILFSFKFFGNWIVFLIAKKKKKATEPSQTPVTVTDKQT